MSKIISFLMLAVFLLATPFQNQVFALDECLRFNITGETAPPQPIPEGRDSINITFKGPLYGPYQLKFPNGATSKVIAGVANEPSTTSGFREAADGQITILVNKGDGKLNRGTQTATLQDYDTSKKEFKDLCGPIRYKVGFNKNDCSANIRPSDPRANEKFALDIKNAPTGKYAAFFQDHKDKSNTIILPGDILVGSDGKGTAELGPSTKAMVGELTIKTPTDTGFCKVGFTINPDSGQPPRPIPTPLPPSTVTTVNTSSQITICTPPGGTINSGVPTAIGCIPTQPATLVKYLLIFIIGISGGIALLLMAFGAFGMITSAGNPESLKGGQDRFTSAIIGLLFIIFSVLLLKIIGVDILDIGKFFGP